MKLKIKKTSKIIYLVVITLAILCLAELLVTNRLSTMGWKVQALEKEADQLKKENEALTEEMSLQASLARIALRAQELGFVQSDSVSYLTPQIPVALK